MKATKKFSPALQILSKPQKPIKPAKVPVGRRGSRAKSTNRKLLLAGRLPAPAPQAASMPIGPVNQ